MKLHKLLALFLVVAMIVPMATSFVPVSAAETATKAAVADVLSWDFSNEAQLADFNLYQSGSSSFVVRDGMLKATGSDGEMKAMVNMPLEHVEYMSVDIIPGQTPVNSGVYVGASNAENAAGQIDALAFLVESMCSGWADAPNRIDIVTGSFAPWKELDRIISESGKGNALYTNGIKKPVTLRLDFDTDHVMITLSLVEDPAKYTQTTYYCDTAALKGQIGLRAQYSDVAFDNLQIKVKNVPADSLLEGLSFAGADACVAQTDTAIAQIPNTIEMWVKLNPREKSDTREYRQPLISSINPAGSASSTAGDFALFTNAAGNLWWYEVTETSISDTSSAAEKYEMKMLSAKNYCNGEWTHVAVTREEGKVHLYINGEWLYTMESAAVGYAGQPQNPITLGYSSIATAKAKNNLNGTIGDVRLWSTTRTQAQICADMYREIDAQQDGLMHYWKLDEQQGTVFYDAVSGGINGAIAPIVSFTQETGLEFAGVNEAVATMNAPVDHIPQALEFWVKIDKDTKADQETLIAAYSGQTQALGKSGDWYLGTGASGTLRWVEKNANGQSGQMNGKTSIATGKWTHVAVVRYEGDIKFYINGVEDTVTKAAGVKYITLDQTKTKSETTPILGHCVYNTASYTNYLDGAMKDIRLWDVDRTQAQIQADMNKTLTGQEEGLMHYWKLDETSGNVITDAAGENNGSITGTTTAWIGGAGMVLPGVNQPLVTAEKAASTIPQTVEMWVKLDGSNTNPISALISAYNAKTQVAIAGDWQLDIKNGKMRWVDMTGKGKSGQLTGASVIPVDQWVHLAVTRESGKVKFYVNGQLDAAVNYTMFENSTTSYTAPVLGYSIFDTATYGSYLKGAVKDVRLWNVTRTAEEIAANMNTTLTGNEAGLMNYWKMDEVSGMIAGDSATSGTDIKPTVYWSTQESEPVEEPAYTNDGFNFQDGNPWQTAGQISATIHAVEAWVKVPKATADNSRLTVISAYPDHLFHMDIYTKGRPRLYAVNAEGVGQNYVANVDVRTNEWTHIAWTCDNDAGVVTCYINGEAVYTSSTLGGSITVGRMYIGRDDRSGWQYPFVGEVADVRVWDKVLTADEVRYSMNTTNMNQAEGLVLDLPLDEPDDAKTFRDLSANNYEVELWERVIEWLDVEKQPSDYSIAIIPDQQILTHHHPEKLNNMYQWIADQVEPENIQAVITVGDITDDNSILHWERAKEAYNIIDGKVPFIPVPGNHDYHYELPYRCLDNYNTYFPISLMENQGTESGFYTRDKGLTDDVANHWQAFEVQGHKYLVMALEFGPRDSVLEWAGDVIAAHPEHQAILVTHGYITHDGTWLDGTDAHVPSGYAFTKGEDEPANNADGMWEKLVSKHENIIMVLSGHILKSDNVLYRVDIGDHGNEVYQFLIDGQNMDGIYGGFGLVAMMNFRDDGQTVEFTYYATDKGKYFNEENQFTFTLPAPKKSNVAQVGENTYSTVTEAVENANGQTVTMLADTDEAIVINSDVTIDLAGYNLSNVTVAEGGKLNLIDTCTGGTAAVTGNVETFTEADGITYLVVGSSNVYSAHSYDVAITHITLDPKNDALGYKAALVGDETVQAYATELGFNLWVTEDRVITEGKAASAITLRLKNILANNGGEMDIHATAYVTFNVNGQTYTKTCGQQTTSMKQTLQYVDAAWSGYTETQQTAVKDLCSKFYDVVSQWDLKNIFPIIDIPIG